jgi:predicted nucleotidyltransferase
MKEPLTKEEIARRLRDALPTLREKYGVERIALYGSYAKGTHIRATSDVDILVQFKRPLGLAFVELAEVLEELLGRKVDLVTFETLRRSMENPRYRHIAADIQRTLVDV